MVVTAWQGLNDVNCPAGLDGGNVTTTGYIHGDLIGTTRAVSGAYAEVIR